MSKVSSSFIVNFLLLFYIFAFVNITPSFAVGSDGVWVQIPNMPNFHVWGSGIILLDNGKVLVTTGVGKTGLTPKSELFDPKNRTWTNTGNVNQARLLHNNAIVKLNDGKVMIAGDEGPNVSDLKSVELYDPAAGTWTYTISLNTPRRYDAIVLQNGKVLVTGGALGPPNDSRYLASTEIYDPATKKWTSSGSLNVPREGAPEIVLLKNGKVLLAGGYYKNAFIDKAEIYDPTNEKWTTSQMPYAWGGATMTVLHNGKVLVAGGSKGYTNPSITAQAMLYDPNTNTWTATGSMHTARAGHNAALLTDGKVIVIGGGAKSTEVYDPITGIWTVGAETRFPSHNGIALLQNGDILAVGGDPDGLTAELFTTPPTPTPPEPFLDLPWNYDCQQSTDPELNEKCECQNIPNLEEKAVCEKDKKILSFDKAVFNINSWFDHQYPLQNYGSDAKDVLTFIGKRENYYYKSHSGYDYGAPVGIKMNSPVLAAAAGWAEFKPASKSAGAGNMIKIDHGNGYQTWYEHLDMSNLIVRDIGEKKHVEKGQKIGEVGMSGRTTGPHIHLSVFKDTNDNKNFDDDYPYGSVDPLGWDGKYKDPWTEWTNDPPEKENKSYGASSYNLFIKRAQPKLTPIPQTGGTLKTDDNKMQIDVPSNAADSAFTLTHKYGPFESFESGGKFLESIVPSFFLDAVDEAGEAINQFREPIRIIYSYSGPDVLNVKETTLIIYFFDELLQNWTPLPSVVDTVNKTVTALTTHNSHFALMGEVKDNIAPTTEIVIHGDKGEDNWYRSKVTVELNGKDNEGGIGLEYALYSLDNENWQIYSTPLDFDQDGEYAVTYQSFDKVGNEGVRNTTAFRIDTTPPSVTAKADRIPDTDEWYNHPVTIIFTGQDAGSEIDKCTDPIIYKEPDNMNAVVEGSCTDKAGNIGSASIHFKYDSTPPTLTASAFSKGNPYAPGSWINQDVAVTFNCIDDISGVEKFSDPITITNEGKDQSVTGTCADNAGNKNEISFTGINIDKTSPEAEISYDLLAFDSKIKGKDNLGSTTMTIDKNTTLTSKIHHHRSSRKQSSYFNR